MRHRYSHLDPDLIRRLLAEMGLRRLFNHLLLQSGGDVDEAMRWMRLLQHPHPPHRLLDVAAALQQQLVEETAQPHLREKAADEVRI